MIQCILGGVFGWWWKFHQNSNNLLTARLISVYICGALGPIHYIALKAIAMALGDGTKYKTCLGVLDWSYVVPEGPKEESIFKIGVLPAAYVFLLLILPNSQRLCSYAMRDKSTTDIIFSFDGTYFNRVLSDCKQLFRKCLA